MGVLNCTQGKRTGCEIRRGGRESVRSSVRSGEIKERGFRERREKEYEGGEEVWTIHERFG